MNKKYQKKTILQVVPALISGGVERGTIEIAKQVVASGNESIVISAGGPLVEDLTKFGSKHITMNVASKNPFVIFKNARKIIKIIKENDVDLIHARSRAPAWSCFFAAKKTGIKLITTFHGIYNFDNPIKKLYNSVMTKGDTVIAVSSFVKKHIVDNYNVDPEKVKIIHRGVDVDDFCQSSVKEETLEKYRKKYNVPEGVPVILLPGRLTKWKGHLLLIKALKKMRGMNFYCIIAGDLEKRPAYVNKVKDKIFKHNLQQNIRLFGNEPDIKNLYAISDIVLSTSIEPEAFGRTIIEAQAMEKIVIATNIGGASETVSDGVTGFHVPPGSAKFLNTKIKHCLTLVRSELSEQVGQRARKSVKENFSLDLMLKNTLEVYQLNDD